MSPIKADGADLVTLSEATATFGATAKGKLSNPSAAGQPEDQLRAPFEAFLQDLAEIVKFPRGSVDAVGETSLADIKTRPDYAVTVRKALVGHVELKAPGKGADPRKFKDQHDKDQWQRLKALPNLIYSDGNEFSLWHDGVLSGAILRLDGDVASSGRNLKAPAELAPLFERFLSWNPQPPRSAKELAHVSARLCRLLRDEVTEQLDRGSPGLTNLAEGWRVLLFPDATNERFADGYAQAVTFGLLMARARDIDLATGFHTVADELGKTNSLIGAALDLLTQNKSNRDDLRTSLDTLIRVLDAVSWKTISKGDPEAWLYFYEEFLSVYDNRLRKLTGSYYTPPEVVSTMVRLVDEELRGPRFNRYGGMASPSVTLADPAVGTGTFLLGILRRIAATVATDQGPGAVPGAINDAIKRLIGFELQLGPFAVAQLRILAEIVELTGAPPISQPRMFVTDTLADPRDDQGWIPGILAPIASSRKDANKIKREESITVVIGNPPYREHAGGMGGWVEGQGKEAERSAPLADWRPPKDWGIGAHARHLRNLYIYFWRWATWKVFDFGPGNKNGIICFITTSGFLTGPAFEKMRDYLRRTCDAIWVIDCTPEGLQPEVSSRIFEAVQQPVCIVMASRSPLHTVDTPAQVDYRQLAPGNRVAKFDELLRVELGSPGWRRCSADWRAPFVPTGAAGWLTYPSLSELFVYSGTGVMSGRTWIVAPDSDSLNARWQRLVQAPDSDKGHLFFPHLRKNKQGNLEPGDKHVDKSVAVPLAGLPAKTVPVREETGLPLVPMKYGFRSLDRQWIIPDSRLINQPNPELWSLRSSAQVYLTAPMRESPGPGPSLTVTCLVPDVHHYAGRGGRVFPLWADSGSTAPNVRAALVSALEQRYGAEVSAEEFFCYLVAVAAHPAFTRRFAADLSTPGIRIPVTEELDTFRKGAELGRWVIWLQTFGERMSDPNAGRPGGPPRLPPGIRPVIPAGGQIPSDSANMPDTIDYDAGKRRLLIGRGFVDNIPVEVWNYEISGKQVLRQWFSYRKRNRERPIIGDRRPPSPLGDIQPDHWLPEYTEELINVLNVLAMLVDLEPKQAKLLDEVCSGPTITVDQLRAAGAFVEVAKPKQTAKAPKKTGRRAKATEGERLFGDEGEGSPGHASA